MALGFPAKGMSMTALYRYFFPDGELVRIGEALPVAEQAGFEHERTNVYQTLLSKSHSGAVSLPLTRADIYRP